MSDTSQGDGWWQASDQKWYPPHSEAELPPPPPAALTPPPPAFGSVPIEMEVKKKSRANFGTFYLIGFVLQFIVIIVSDYNRYNEVCEFRSCTSWTPPIVDALFGAFILGFFWGGIMSGVYFLYKAATKNR